MSLVGQRQEIADALSTVTGVHGHPYRPAVIGPGDAWPLLDNLNRDQESSPDFLVTWRLLVVLATVDERRSAEQLDALQDAVIEALVDVGWVRRIEPVPIATSAGDHEVMMITLVREA